MGSSTGLPARRPVAWGRRLVVALPYLWFALFFLAPFALILKISLSEAVLGQPPYRPLFDWAVGWWPDLRLNFGNFGLLLQDPLYRAAFGNSLLVAAVSRCCVCCSDTPWPMASPARPGRFGALSWRW